MWAHLIAAMQPWWHTLHLLALLIGLALVIASLVSAAAKGRSRQGGLHAPILTFFAGIFLLNISGLMDAVAFSMFGTSSAHSLIAYASGAGHVSGPMVQFAIMLVQLVGFYGIIRGVLLLSHSGSDSRAAGPALVHILGGAIAVNIVTVLNVLGATVGGGIQSAITRMF